MTTSHHSNELELISQRAPRYTSYPTAAHFREIADPEITRKFLSSVQPAEEISLYVHIPFCKRLCWFCACRTQGTSSSKAVSAYVEILRREIDIVAEGLPKGVTIGNLHLGGGTPTTMTPEGSSDLLDYLFKRIPLSPEAVFNVETDPTDVDEERIAALVEKGMNRASIGVQDFEPCVQKAIGRRQTFEQTEACVNWLQRYGVASVNMDILYGLPLQDMSSLQRTLQKVLTLRPSRLAAFGYAHVPWMSKRQQMINDADLPEISQRLQQVKLIERTFSSAGYAQVGIDHFALPDDPLAVASLNKSLRRNFQGYTDDRFETLIGLGASAISKYRTGYIQNTSASKDYVEKIEGRQLATARGHVFEGDDVIRARVIEMLMCSFEVDLAQLKIEFRTIPETILSELSSTAEQAHLGLSRAGNKFYLKKKNGYAARLISLELDQYSDSSQQKFSLAV